MSLPSADAFARGVQLRHLRCLVAVARERHLARAAERLSLSQPAVSKTLAELEALAGTRLVERGGPGLGGIQPSQSDYWQATKALGHGDFQMVVYAPSTVQEMAPV